MLTAGQTPPGLSGPSHHPHHVHRPCRWLLHGRQWARLGFLSPDLNAVSPASGGLPGCRPGSVLQSRRPGRPGTRAPRLSDPNSRRQAPIPSLPRPSPVPLPPGVSPWPPADGQGQAPLSSLRCCSGAGRPRQGWAEAPRLRTASVPSGPPPHTHRSCPCPLGHSLVHPPPAGRPSNTHACHPPSLPPPTCPGPAQTPATQRRMSRALTQQGHHHSGTCWPETVFSVSLPPPPQPDKEERDPDGEGW